MTRFMRIVTAMLCVVLALPLSATAAADTGEYPDGKTDRKVQAVTWDFETGDLMGWMVSGNAFTTQPTFGDNPTARHRGQPSNHQGQYWIGSYENRPTASDPPGRIQGDGPQGTLTSMPFEIANPVISFLLGGGCDLKTERVELLSGETVIRQATGKCNETMERKCWDVSDLRGRNVRIRLVDNSSGAWGHINIDDMRFAGTFNQDVRMVIASERCKAGDEASTPSATIHDGGSTTQTIRTYRKIRVR